MQYNQSHNETQKHQQHQCQVQFTQVMVCQCQWFQPIGCLEKWQLANHRQGTWHIYYLCSVASEIASSASFNENMKLDTLI